MREALLRVMSTVRVKSVGHPMTIYSAVYRAISGEELDVKTILEHNIKDNRIRMMVTNRTMGKDPRYGMLKVLYVRHAVDQNVREVEVEEEHELRIPE